MLEILSTTVEILKPFPVAFGILGVLVAAGLIISDRKRWLGSGKTEPYSADFADSDANSSRERGSER